MVPSCHLEVSGAIDRSVNIENIICSEPQSPLTFCFTHVVPCGGVITVAVPGARESIMKHDIELARTRCGEEEDDG